MQDNTSLQMLMSVLLVMQTLAPDKEAVRKMHRRMVDDNCTNDFMVISVCRAIADGLDHGNWPTTE